MPLVQHPVTPNKNGSPSPKRRQTSILCSSPRHRPVFNKETPSSPRKQQITISEKPPARTMKPRVTGQCEAHADYARVTRSTVKFYCGMASDAVLNAPESILTLKPQLVFPWANGMEIIDEYADNKGDWRGCCICVVMNIILGPGALPLMVGLLVAEKDKIYEKCLNGMKLALEEERVQILNNLYHELAGIYESHSVENPDL